MEIPGRGTAQWIEAASLSSPIVRTGRSRGFGFVTFANDEGAASAIAHMDGSELDGRTIKVNEAEDKGPHGGGGGGGGGGGYGGGRGGRGGKGGGQGGRGPRGGGGGGGGGGDRW